MLKPDTSFYITTAIPYVNAKPHLGHVLEWFQADAVARYQRLSGKEVAFVAGADENSLKNVQAAEKAGLTTQAWLDMYSKIFEDSYTYFDVSLTSFRRGSDEAKHWPGVQELWYRCVASGDIYKKTYTGLYCVGCESFYAPDELIDGKCPEHLTVPEKVEEENYFFRLSKYEKEIHELILSDKLKIISEHYKNEMLGFLQKGLEDFSVSRSAKRAKGVGVPVPEDANQIMYVWFDALSIYLTAIGWGYDQAHFEKFWPADVHFIGKGINRFHSIYWIGMLLSAQLPPPKVICVHGYMTANGMKMSKSLGNVVDPFEITKKYGIEPIRYYLLKDIPTHSDGDFSEQRFRELYSADLANGIGNLCSRVSKLCEKISSLTDVHSATEFAPGFIDLMDDMDIDKAMQWVFQHITETDHYLSEKKPWIQSGSDFEETLNTAVEKIIFIAFHLQPFLPKTAKTILDHFQKTRITAIEPLFPRLP